VDSNLLPGETVTYRAHLHPMIFAAPIIFLALSGIRFIGAALSGFSSDDPARVGAMFLGLLFFLSGFIVGLSRYLTYISSEFAITDKRVLIKVSLLSRRTVELLLSKVETIGVDQGISGRILNYGTIIVTGTGGTKEPFNGIANPLEYKHGSCNERAMGAIRGGLLSLRSTTLWRRIARDRRSFGALRLASPAGGGSGNPGFRKLTRDPLAFRFALSLWRRGCAQGRPQQSRHIGRRDQVAATDLHRG
jgi:hypothetical protein